MALFARLPASMALVFLLAGVTGHLLSESRCSHGGRYNPVGWCECLYDYHGDTCEIAWCDPNDDDDCRCARWNASLCTTAAVRILCPRLCGNCSNPCGTKGRTCQHGGSLNVSNCAACKCEDSFTGPACETLNCTGWPDPAECGTEFVKSDCTQSEYVAGRCPVLCGLCNQTGIRPTTDYHNSTDEWGYCDNLGCFENSTDTCECPPGYEGFKCETLNCDKIFYDNEDCDGMNVTDCIVAEVSTLCPFLCGKCPADKASCLKPLRQCGGSSNCSSLIPSIVKESCVAYCNNSGKWDEKTSKCICLPWYTGHDCSNLISAPDDPRCRRYNATMCANSGLLKVFCPITCSS